MGWKKKEAKSSWYRLHKHTWPLFVPRVHWLFLRISLYLCGKNVTWTCLHSFLMTSCCAFSHSHTFTGTVLRAGRSAPLQLTLWWSLLKKRKSDFHSDSRRRTIRSASSRVFVLINGNFLEKVWTKLVYGSVMLFNNSFFHCQWSKS